MPGMYILFNPLANNGNSVESVNKLLETIEGEKMLCDMTQGYIDTVSSLEQDDVIVICGGDGTLNRFVNETEGIEIENDILYYAIGSGNDFARDIALEREAAPVSISKYLKNQGKKPSQIKDTQHQLKTK